MLLLVATTVGAMLAATSFGKLARDNRKERNAALQAQALAEKREKDADAARQQALDLAEINEQRAYASEMLAASGFANQQNGLARVRELVDRWVPAGGRIDRRAWEWYYLKSLAHREIATLEGQGWTIETTWGPRSKAVLMVSSDGRVDSFHVATGQVKTLATFSVPMRHAVWSRALTLLAAACVDGKIRVWSMATKKLLAELVVGNVRDMAWHSNGQWLAAITEKEKVFVWDWQKREIIRRLEGRDFFYPNFVSWHPQKPLLATISRKEEIVVINVASGETQYRHEPYGSWLHDLEWNPDGRRIAFGDSSQIQILDTQRQEISAMLKGHQRVISEIAWHPKGNQLAASLHDRTVRIWNVEHGTVIHVLRGHLNKVKGVAWSPDGRLVASVAEDSLRVWDAVSGADDLVYPALEGCCRWLPHPDQIAVSDGQTLKILNATTGKTTESWSVPSAIASFAFDATAKQVAYRGRKGRVWISDRGDSSERLVLDEGVKVEVADFQRTQGIAWSPDNSLLAAATSRAHISIWDTATGALVATPRHQPGRVLALAWSPDGQMLAYGGDDSTVAYWDVQTRRGLRTTRNKGWVCGIHWTSDSSKLLVTADSEIHVFETSSGQCLRRLTGPASDARAVTATADDSRIAAASYDGAITIWDGRTGNLLAAFQAHPKRTHWVCWNTDETRLASLGGHDALRLLDAQTGLEQAGDPRAIFRLIRSFEDGLGSARDIQKLYRIVTQPDGQDEVICSLEAFHSQNAKNNSGIFLLANLRRQRAERHQASGRMKEAKADREQADAVSQPPPWPLPADAPEPAVVPFETSTARQHQEAWAKYLGVPLEITNSIGMKLVLIPPGELIMGSPLEEIAELLQSYDYSLTEGPQHWVRVTRPYYLGQYEVTVSQFRAFVNSSGYKTDAESDGQGGRIFEPAKGLWPRRPDINWRSVGFEQTGEHPVVQVSWNDCLAFCQWLSKREDKTYTLPTEAQWEHGCRSGSTSRWCIGDDRAVAKQSAWCSRQGGDCTKPVGQKSANGFGLFDVHGNVQEWCHDWHGENYYSSSPLEDPPGPASGFSRVIRGGGWCYSALIGRSASRHSCPPSHRFGNLGFRVALALADAKVDRSSTETKSAKLKVDQPERGAKPAKIQPKP